MFFFNPNYIVMFTFTCSCLFIFVLWQSEGSAVWFAAPGRDISGLQPSSFYNIPPQGPVSFTPPQSHGTFTGIYHPAQTVSASSVHPLLQQSQTMASPADIPGPTAGAYQPQHAQFNWPNNYWRIDLSFPKPAKQEMQSSVLRLFWGFQQFGMNEDMEKVRDWPELSVNLKKDSKK